MAEKFIKSETWLRNKTHVTCYVPVPDVDSNPETAAAMGKCKSEKKENIMKFAEEMLFPQYFRAMKKIITQYEQSQMPLRYLKGQEIIILPLFEITTGAFCENGNILIDNNTCIGARRAPGELVIGHEIGHKLLRVKKTKEVKELMARRVPVNRYLVEEILAELTGEIVSEQESEEFFWLDSNTKNEIKQAILKLACN